MGKTITRVSVVLLLLFALVVTPLHAQAEETIATQSALAVSPAILEDILTPGAPTSFTVQVQNITGLPLPIKTFVRGLTVEDHTTDLSEDEQTRLDVSQWFTIEEPDFILQPNQMRAVTGTIHTPVNADPGGHYATIFFQPLVPAEALRPSMAYINARVGVLSFLVVKGDITQKAELVNGIQTDRLVQHDPITFRFTIHNSGNTHLLPTGKLAIYTRSGDHVADLAVPPGIVLPDTSREYTVTWDGPSKPGKYKAELSIEYGADKVQLPKATTTFWVVPWVGLTCSILILGGGLFFVIKTRKRLSRAWHEIRGTNKD